MKLDTLILKYALQNAVYFKGKAQVGAVMGKVLSEEPKLKKDAQKLSKNIQEVVKKVNKLSLAEQRKQLEKLDPALLEKKKGEERKELLALKGAQMGKVVTRLPPEPSKYNHVGHALSFLINYMYAKKYKGKCILRFEDTNPLTSKQEYVDAMKEDVLEYLHIKPNKIVFASDELPKLYKYAEQLIKAGKAYICNCKPKKMQELRHEGETCVCHDKGQDFNMQTWKKMLNREFKEGEFVLRLKGDICADNHCMRDPVIFRIVYDEHYRQKKKYCVWPLYDFENAILDSLNGVTHILRSSEFGYMRIELQNYIKDLLGLKKQIAIHYGRMNIIGATTKGREIRKLIEEKSVMGWDDPRLVTLRAMKRRGIDYRTFYEMVYKVGLSLTPTNIDWRVIASANRKIIDKEVNRYFFVLAPKLVTIKGAPEQNVSLELHPDFPKRGLRKFKTKDKFYLARDDYDSLKQRKLYRLMECLNFVKKDKLEFDSLEYEKYREKGERIFHWLPKQGNVNVEVVMPDSKCVSGLGEPLMKKLKVGEVIQAERFGFMRLDSKEKDKLVFWYTHK